MPRNTSWIQMLRNVLCGLLIGGGAILPGVSGGVLAVVFGIYQPCMEILISPVKSLPKYWKMLIPVGIGAAAGFVLFAKGLSVLFAWSDAVAVWLFIGLILGTIPQLFREAGKTGRRKGNRMAFVACFLLMLAGLLCVGRGAALQVTPGAGWYFLSGVLFGLGMIVPGMTSSAVLMALGLYEPILNALTALDFSVLIPIVPGVVLSVLLLARLVNWLLGHYHAQSLHGILGIVVASTLAIVPLSYQNTAEIVLSALCAMGGYSIARLMDFLDHRIQAE